MKLKANIHGKEYEIVQGATFSDEYNETLDSANIIINHVGKIDLSSLDDVYIYSTESQYHGHTKQGNINISCEIETSENGSMSFRALGSDYSLVNSTITAEYNGKEVHYELDQDESSDQKLVFNVVETETGGVSTMVFSRLQGKYTSAQTYGKSIDAKVVYYVARKTTSVSKPMFYKHMLVDQFTEEEINLVEHIYKYKIELFSETKGLEKVHCPNLCITQPLNASKKKSIYQYIKDYVNLYTPKIKLATDEEIKVWNYQDKYSVDESLEELFGNVYAPEMQLTTPTLRELLTQLMLVKDMIPYVEDDVIKALDISARNGVFSTSESNLNGVVYNMSSDQHCDNLRRNYMNAISQDKSCRMIEKMGFRNCDNALMTLDNMRLETRYPIYKINKLYVCYYKKAKAVVEDEVIKQFSRRVTFVPSFTISKVYDGRITKVELEYDTSYGSLEVDSITYDGPTDKTTIVYKGSGISGTTDVNAYLTLVPNNAGRQRDVVFLCKQDITGLVLLNNVRNTLSMDYDAMTGEKPKTVEDMAKYKPFTIGYTMGNQNITGWGTKYSYPILWWDWQKTYIENIMDTLDKNNPYGVEGQSKSGEYVGLEEYEYLSVDTTTVFKDMIVTPYSNHSLAFKGLFFEMDYNALYSGCVVHSKDDAKHDHASSDNTQNSLSLLEVDGLYMKEKANRFGNRGCKINARHSSVYELQKLGSVRDEDEIIYHREYAVYDEFVPCIYYATKDYVLKNYYTSVFAKLRLYNLMTYSESVSRAENRKTMLLFSKDEEYYENENKQFEIANVSDFISCFEPRLVYDTNGVNCGIIDDKYLSDVNIFTSGYSMCLSLRTFDNATGGVHLGILEPEYSLVTITDDYKGTTQEWYISVDDEETGRNERMKFELATYDSKSYFDEDTLIDEDDAKDKYELINAMPKVDSSFKKESVVKCEFDIHKDNKEYVDMTFQVEPIARNGVYVSPMFMKLSDVNRLYQRYNDDYTIPKGDKYGVDVDAHATMIRTLYDNINAPVMAFEITDDIKESLVKGKRYNAKASYNFFSTNRLGGSVVSYSFEINNIYMADYGYIVAIGKETTTTQTLWVHNTQVKEKKVYFKSVESFGGYTPSQGHTLYMNVVPKLLIEQAEWVKKENSPLEKAVTLTDFSMIGCKNDRLYTNSDTGFTSSNSVKVDFKLYSSDATITYKKNMFVELSTESMKKTIVYEERKALDYSSIDVSDMFKFDGRKLFIDLSGVPQGTKSLRYFFKDGVKYNSGVADESEAVYKFVFGVNLTDDEIAKGYTQVYVSAVSSHEHTVYDIDYNEVGTMANYAKDSFEYGKMQHYKGVTDESVN